MKTTSQTNAEPQPKNNVTVLYCNPAGSGLEYDLCPYLWDLFPLATTPWQYVLDATNTKAKQLNSTQNNTTNYNGNRVNV